jgi:hypothetical protein
MGRGNNKVRWNWCDRYPLDPADGGALLQRTMRRDFKTPRDNSWSEKKAKIDNEQTNESFEEYYKAQGIVPEGQWEDFLAALRRQLPTTFRINGSGQFANDLRDRLQSDFFSQFNKDDIMVRCPVPCKQGVPQLSVIAGPGGRREGRSPAPSAVVSQQLRLAVRLLPHAAAEASAAGRDTRVHEARHRCGDHHTPGGRLHGAPSVPGRAAAAHGTPAPQCRSA